MKMTKREYRIALQRQKFTALGFLAICVFCIVMCAHGQTMEEQDCTIVLFMLPVGLYMLFTKKVVIYY